MEKSENITIDFYRTVVKLVGEKEALKVFLEHEHTGEPEVTLIAEYISLNNKLPAELRYSPSWTINAVDLPTRSLQTLVVVRCETASGELIYLKEPKEEFPSEELVATMMLLL